ncbi:MAG: GTPase HflX [Crenarchaeota archaeon]|nr:GTPase HflX [Thermoproteota archaeon]
MHVKNAALIYVDYVVHERKLSEFKLLAEAAGYRPVIVLVQEREPDSRYYLGPGKLKELKDEIKRSSIDVVITYHELKPKQHFNLERELGVTVMDRVELILEIFSKRAGTREAKLQIELAQLKHRLPLIREYIRLAKMGEQIGYHGAGEYAVEAYYRYVRRRITTISRELREIRSRKRLLIVKRRERGLPEIVLTGYTMAGKTTLFNRLCKEFKYRDGRPFATLSTYSSLIDLGGIRAILTDTIGFIDDLPPLLIEAFYATIEEIAQSDLILLVLDVSESLDEFERKLSTSLKVLRDLTIPMEKVLPVLNKIDIVSEKDVEKRVELVKKVGLNDPVPISAEKGINIDVLRRAIVEKLAPQKIEVFINVDQIPEWIFKYAKVEQCDGKVILRPVSSYTDRIVRWLENMNIKYSVSR